MQQLQLLWYWQQIQDYTAASFQTALNNAVAVATDVTDPTITKAVYNAGTDTLTFTFSEAVDVTAQTAKSTIGFKNGVLAGSTFTTATAGVAAPLNDVTSLSLVLDGTQSTDGFAVSSVITSITAGAGLTIQDNSGKSLVVTGLNITVE